MQHSNNVHTCENGMAQEQSPLLKWLKQQTIQKRNVFGSDHQKKLQGLQSENRTVAQVHCSATAAY